jgi:hypothetical protein
MARTSILSDKIRLFIVERLAVFDSPQTVAAAVKNEFGLVISRQAVEAYDPTRKAGQRLSPKLREHFYRTRQKFRRDIDDIPLASKAARLAALSRMAERFEEMGNYLGAAALIEQAAKEVGGVYVGRAGGVEGSAQQSGSAEPRYLGADRLNEIAARFAKRLMVVEGGKDSQEDKSALE